MRTGWQTKTLGDVFGKTETVNPVQAPEAEFQYIDVSSISNKTFRVEQVQQLRGKDAPSRARRLVRANDVLFATIRPTLQRIAIIPEELDGVVCSTGYFILRPKSEIDHRFLFYFLFTEGFMGQMESLQKGASYPAVTDAEVRAQEFSFPSLAEQQRIVGILDEAFEGIATAKANAEKNLQNARAIFESYLNAVFTEKGHGWVEKTLGEVCTLRSGTTVDKSLEKAAGDLPYLKVADMSHLGNELAIFSSSRFLNKSDIGKNAILPTGTTIFPKRGGAILTNKKRLTAVPICADLNIMGVIPSRVLLPKFLFFYFLNVDMRQLGSGSSIPQINNYDIEPLVIAFPQATAEQDRIVSILEDLSAETQRLESIYQRKLAALDALKKSLLNQAFTGQL
ncbi:restriction endonuclease subunit S [uncultured Thiodictyon sp.]|uniref:restriction endonuclease subunit S n=1 Tax=uncultured Thiodictyon sp. TaxID=1846217 RepID=UPI00260021E1|nr:restriction endonuclease subunit S [uncultured Thiodictyon sp.]